MPEEQWELLRAISEIVKGHARRHGLGSVEAKRFQAELQSEWDLGDEIKIAAQKVWTSTKTLGTREFCSIFSEALRSDCEGCVQTPCQRVHIRLARE